VDAEVADDLGRAGALKSSPSTISATRCGGAFRRSL
jgi:hypothetical protein